MFVTLELHGYREDTAARTAVRRVTLRRRSNWNPPAHYRETMATPIGYAWRDYRFDAKASAERSVFVYRQITPSPPTGANA
jgi:hypothetical protein